MAGDRYQPDRCWPLVESAPSSSARRWRTSTALYGAAYRLTRNPRDAEDLVQDSLLRAYRFWDSFQQDSNCKAWLLRIVTNTFINEYQRKKRSREVLDAASAEQDATDGVLVQASAADKQSPAQAMLARSVSDDVQRALDCCPTISAPR